MPPPRRYNYKDHWVIVNDDNTVTIKPKHVDPRHHTIRFGLGDAVFTINTANPPRKIVAPITGESHGEGLFPPDPFEFRDLNVFAKAITNISKNIEGWRGNVVEINYPCVTDGFSSRHAASDVGVNLAGPGAGDIEEYEKIEW